MNELPTQDALCPSRQEQLYLVKVFCDKVLVKLGAQVNVSDRKVHCPNSEGTCLGVPTLDRHF